MTNLLHSSLCSQCSRILRTFLLANLLVWLSTGCSDGSSSVPRDVHTTRCISDVSAFERHEFQCDGVVFKVLLTQECIDQACGVIFDVHGWLSNPDEQEGRSNLARLAMETGGYIVVQPGELSEPSSWVPSTHNSVVFDFLQQSMEAFDVDQNRIHFTGFSQGGLMTWQFVCDHADIIASAAPLSSPEISCFRASSGPKPQLPLFYISGTKDVLVNYFNGDSGISVVSSLVGIMFDYGMVTSTAGQYQYSQAGDLVLDEEGRIDIASEDVLFDVVDGDQGGNYFWTRYTNAEGIAFEHLRHTNGHVYPDNPDSLIFPEDPSVWFSVGEAILQFFIQNPKK